MDKSNTVVSAYTLYRHLQLYCSRPSPLSEPICSQDHYSGLASHVIRLNINLSYYIGTDYTYLLLELISMGESNTVVSAYTMYRHLQLYCSHPLILCSQDP